MKPPPADDIVTLNRRIHDEVASRYDELHSEIYNPTEQRRLIASLRDALDLRPRANHRALDVGSGTGNITRKLLPLDPALEVHAADVSPEMLALLRQSCSQGDAAGRLTTHQLDGDVPLPFPDGHFGFVALYSVLHHVSDYLALVADLTRVLDDGGILYIDHEMTEDHWRSPPGVRVHRALTMPGYVLKRVLIRSARAFGYRERDLPPIGAREPIAEGDIHIYADDHVEWARVSETARRGGVVEIEMKEYLLCRESARFPWRYLLCRRFATDMGTYIGRKQTPDERTER